MTITTMIKRAAVGLLLSLVATGLSAKDTDKGTTDGQYVKVKPTDPTKDPKSKDKPIYVVSEPAGLALLSVGLGAVGLGMVMRRRKRR